MHNAVSRMQMQREWARLMQGTILLMHALSLMLVARLIVFSVCVLHCYFVFDILLALWCDH